MADEPEDLDELPPEELEGDAGTAGDEADGEEEYSIELEGEEAEEEPSLVKNLRQEIRDRDKRLAQFERAPAKIVVGEKPKLDDFWESPDTDAAYEAALLAWHERKRQAETQEADAATQAETRNTEFQRRAVNYKTKLAALPLPDARKEAAEQTVIAALPELLQSAIIAYADDPAKVVLALAAHPKKLEQLAQEADPIRFVIAMKALERNLKVVTRKKPGAPESETIQRGSAPLSTTVDKEGERLLAEAQRTGNMDKYRAHSRAKRKAA